MDRIDALRLFLRLAERKSFSAAAHDLKIKQSTASKWIAELEAEVGVTLVERTTRALHLTDAGRRLLASSAGVVAAFDQAVDELRARAPEPSGRLRLSIPVVFGKLYILPPLIDLLREHPRIEAEIVLGDRYVNLVEEGFDLAIRVGVQPDTSARGLKLADSRRLLVASPAYLEAHGRPRTARELTAHECLVHGDASAPAIWRFTRERGREVAVPVRGRILANNSEAVLAMVRRGLGIGLLADWLVAADLAAGRVVTLLDDHRTPGAPIYALTPPGRYTLTAVRAVTDHLARALADRLAA